MVHIECECGSTTFHLNFKPPLRCDAVCTQCGDETEIGADNYAGGEA